MAQNCQFGTNPAVRKLRTRFLLSPKMENNGSHEAFFSSSEDKNIQLHIHSQYCFNTSLEKPMIDRNSFLKSVKFSNVSRNIIDFWWSISVIDFIWHLFFYQQWRIHCGTCKQNITFNIFFDDIKIFSWFCLKIVRSITHFSTVFF